MLLTNRFCWFGGWCFGVERQRPVETRLWLWTSTGTALVEKGYVWPSDESEHHSESETREDGTSAWQADMKIHEIHIFFPSSAEHITAVSGTRPNNTSKDPPNTARVTWLQMNTEQAVIELWSCDTIDHSILLNRLDNYVGIWGSALAWFKSYLSDRHQFVAVNNPSLCLLNDDSGLCISSMQKRMLFAGFTAAKTTIIQNWFTPHMCGKTYWIHSLLQIVTYSYNSTNQWSQAFDHWCWPVLSLWYTWLYKGVNFVFFLSFPLSLPFDWTLRYWVCVCCFVLLFFGCYVMLYCW